MKNLFLAWKEFRKGKRYKLDVQEFEFNLEDNIFKLHSELRNKTYKHFHYTSFYVNDPKLRHIHKASVRDRVLHHAIFRILYPIFDKSFIFDSYSCRLGKGTHSAVNRLKNFLRKLSANNYRNIYVLKCDIKKFFGSINQNLLIKIIRNKIKDENLIWLIKTIIRSFQTEDNKGLPLGNVTSQLFANIYLNELDQFVKHRLKVKYYLRYCDDFIILTENRGFLMRLISIISQFLKEKLDLSIHPDKIIIRKYRQGIDFLGYVVLPYHKVLRTKTKRRILKKIIQNKNKLVRGLISEECFNQSLQSYFGVLKHCNGYNIKKEILRIS